MGSTMILNDEIYDKTKEMSLDEILAALTARVDDMVHQVQTKKESIQDDNDQKIKWLRHLVALSYLEISTTLEVLQQDIELHMDLPFYIEKCRWIHEQR